MDTLNTINQRVEEAKDFPKAIIEYSYEELPKAKGITPTKFYGVPARYNKDVPKATGCTIIYTY